MNDLPIPARLFVGTVLAAGAATLVLYWPQALANPVLFAFLLACGQKTISVTAPAARTAPTNSRAAMGRSFTILRLGKGRTASKCYRETAGQAPGSRLLRPAGRTSGSS